MMMMIIIIIIIVKHSSSANLWYTPELSALYRKTKQNKTNKKAFRLGQCR